jgi:peptidoglycan/LPS O-acetylase OafA/YrhL
MVLSVAIEDRGFSDPLLSLRGIAASAVLIFHAMLAFQVNGTEVDVFTHGFPDGPDAAVLATRWIVFLTNGHAAVTFFFVHSGFVLALSLARAPWSEANPVRRAGFVVGFYLRRLFRLWPLVAASCVAIFLFEKTLYQPNIDPTFSQWYRKFFSVDADLNNLLGNIFLQKNNINPFLWSLTLEFYGSALMPLFFFCASTKLRSYALIVIFYAITVSVPSQELFIIGGWRFSVLTAEFLFCMAAGSILAFSLTDLAKVQDNRLWNRTAFAAIGVLITARWLLPVIGLAIIAETLASAAIIYTVYMIDDGAMQRFCRRPVIAFYGKISFSLYVNSLPAIYLSGYLIRNLMPESQMAHGFRLNLICVVLSFVINTPLSYLTYRLIERPFMAMGSKVSALFREPSSRLMELPA